MDIKAQREIWNVFHDGSIASADGQLQPPSGSR